MARTFRSFSASIGKGRDSPGYIRDFVGRIALMFLSTNDVPTNIFGDTLETI